MTHLIRICNMLLGNTKHSNECSNKYSCTEVNYSFLVKIKKYTLAWHSDCTINFCELAFYSERRFKKGLEILTVYLRKTDTQKKRQKDKQLSTNTTQQTKDRATRTLIKTDSEHRCSESYRVPAPLVTPVMYFIKVHIPSQKHKRSCMFMLVVYFLCFYDILITLCNFPNSVHS